MGTRKLSNISLKEFKQFLIRQGLKQVKTNKGRGGHEKWIRKDLLRPIILQSHIDPIPEFIVKQILRHLNLSKEDYFNSQK